jgi:hypothetical protein
MLQNSVATELLSEVADTIKNSTTAVRSRLKDALVEREVASRVDILDKALLKIREVRKEVQKMKPDQVSFDAGGQKIETWSKAAHEAKVKADESLGKLEGAFTAAMLGENFDKLRELVK